MFNDRLAVLRAAVPKYRLKVCRMKKSKIPKLCQDIGLGKLFLKNNFHFDLSFILREHDSDKVCSAALTSVFTGPKHASHKYRLKINEDVNSTCEYLTKKSIHLPIVWMFVRLIRPRTQYFLDFFIFFLILAILARQKNGKIEAPNSQLGTWPGVKSVLPNKRARFLPKVNAIKFFGT